MPVCKHCGKDIDRLDAVVVERNLYEFGLDGQLAFNECLEFNIEAWKCPLCYKKLDIEIDEDSAMRFLKGE